MESSRHPDAAGKTDYETGPPGVGLSPPRMRYHSHRSETGERIDRDRRCGTDCEDIREGGAEERPQRG